jgi:hypothetical protein
MSEMKVFSPGEWCGLDLAARRTALTSAISAVLDGIDGVRSVSIEPGPPGREYDLTALVDTDVGKLRTPLWSHARASIFCDESVHPANRAQIGPDIAAAEAADRLRRRLCVPYRLEPRGLTITLLPEDGVVRTWTAEHSRFRKRTAVVREDLVENAADIDVRDLLTHFYTGPSLRLVSDSGDAFLLDAATDAEGPIIGICLDCRKWSRSMDERCDSCGSGRVDFVVAVSTVRGKR